MSRKRWMMVVAIGVLILPLGAWAQDAPATGLSTGINGLRATLEKIYQTMMKHCGELMGIGRALAGFGTLLYVSYRGWKHLAKAESIDLLPMLRPFGLGLIITFYPAFLGLIGGLMQPTVSGTAALVDDANAAITTLLDQKQAALEQSSDWQMYVGPDGGGSLDKWEQLSGEAESGVFSGLTNAFKFQVAKMTYNFRNGVKIVLAEVLEILYEASALFINTLRCFELILMAILGPLVIGLSVYGPFRGAFASWLGRYITVFLWLPVANIFGSLCGQIQAEMLRIDVQQIQATGSTSFGATDAAYSIFLVIATIGYFCIPSITSRIVQLYAATGESYSGSVGAAMGNAGARIRSVVSKMV